MRILLVADVHANRAALEAIGDEYDVCFALGDLVDYGPDPNPCVGWVRAKAAHSIRGNHDHGVAQHVTVQGKGGFRYLTGVTRPLTQERIGSEERRYLGSLPLTKRVTVDGVRYLLVHATPRDPLDEFAPADAEFWASRLDGVDADVICVGHTHTPYVLEVGGRVVINPGSVGLPRDGDPRAAYAIIRDGEIELKRVAYTIDDTVRAVQAAPLPDLAKAMLTEVYRTGTLPR